MEDGHRSDAGTVPGLIFPLTLYSVVRVEHRAVLFLPRRVGSDVSNVHCISWRRGKHDMFAGEWTRPQLAEVRVRLKCRVRGCPKHDKWFSQDVRGGILVCGYRRIWEGWSRENVRTILRGKRCTDREERDRSEVLCL